MSTFQNTQDTAPKMEPLVYILIRRLQKYQFYLDPHSELSVTSAGLAEVPINIPPTLYLYKQST